MDFLFQLLEPVQSWLFESLVLPSLYSLGLMAHADDAYEATGFFLLGLTQVLLVYLLLRPLERWRPAELWPNRRAIRVDVLYTLLYRSGALPLMFFVMLQPLIGPIEIELHAAGYLPPNLEEWIPGLQAYPLLAFLSYVVVVDFFEYWRHRWQHRFQWWWALHSTHHSQRHLSFWADDRNHVLDGLIEALWLVLIALAVGIPGNQFVFIVLLMRFIESLAHANVHFGFGSIGDRLLVSPRYHRIHHGIGVGHEGKVGGCNFATLFPAWDMLFGTANFERTLPATGIRDQLEGADYGTGFMSQQINGLVRLVRAFSRRPPSPA